jgi:hypothetical protein
LPENGWTVQNGKLPGFGAPVDMPEHLKLPVFTIKRKKTNSAVLLLMS